MNRALYKYISILVISILVWLVGIPFFCMRAVPIICDNITYNSPYKIKIENPKIYTSIIPSAYISADSLKVESKNDIDRFECQKLKIKLRLLPLLSGRIHINSIQISEINLKTNTDTSIIKNYNILDSQNKPKFICDRINIDNFNIAIKNSKQEELPNFKGKNFIYQNNVKYLKFTLDAALESLKEKATANVDLFLPKNKDINKAKININCKNLNIEQVNGFISDILPKDIVNLSGVLNVSANTNGFSGTVNNFKLISKDDAKSIIFPSVLNFNSDLDLSKHKIKITNGKIWSDRLDVVINGTMSDYISKPNMNLNLRINSSKIEDFISMLPIFKTEDIDSYKLKKYKFYGDIIGNLNIKGRFQEPDIIGDIYINNGILTKPIPNAKGASIKLKFTGRDLLFDVLVPAGYSEKVTVNGKVELYNIKYSEMRVLSTSNVDLAVAEEKVVPLHEILNFIIGPVPIMDIKGRGNIDITIKGNRQDPHVWGVFNMKSVTTHFFEIPNLILDRANAVLTFDNDEAVFNLKDGFVNNQKIDINGKCSLGGKFDFDVSTQKQNLNDLYKAIKTSTMIDELKKQIPDFNELNGLVNLSLKVFGNVKDINVLKYNENFFTSGDIELLGNSLNYQGILLKNSKGVLHFDGINSNLDINSYVGNSLFSIKADVKNRIAKAIIQAQKLNLRDLITGNDKFSKNYTNIYTDINLKYQGNIDKIEYDKIDLTAKILNSSQENKIKISKGAVSLKNNNLNIQDISGNFANSTGSFNINLKGEDISSKPVFNGKVILKDFELPLINIFLESSLIPKDKKDILNKIKFENGKININANISNNNINASTNIGGIRLIYNPLNLPIKIINGSIYLRKNNLGVNKINVIADDMPILVDGNIDNIFSDPKYNLYINSKPKQEFIDKYFNNNQLYPLKLKGDIIYWIKLKGFQDNLDIISEANLEKDAGIYYLGATVGDLENKIILNLDANLLKQKNLKIKEFSYDKVISSQNKRSTRINMLKVFGGVDLANNDMNFHDLRIKTTNPTDARIFNIIFKKPNIKQGQFISDLKINGKLSNPKFNGTFKIAETDIPFLDTIIKTLSLNFKDKVIEISSIGEVLGNEIKFKGLLRNKLVPPYYVENAELYTKMIDLNYITEKLKSTQINESNALDTMASFDKKNIIIKNMKLNANEIRLRNLTANDVYSSVSISNKHVFSMDGFKFNIADGTLHGDYSYNLIDNSMKLNLDAKNINANDLTLALFDLDNQIYGSLVGNMKISCNGEDFNKCMQTLNGSAKFTVQDGKMPKLGSLEYLLKAGNLIKGGFTGLSINGVIDILTPLKTGDFSDIYGNIMIKDGIAENIEIATKGKDLSLFITGQYNFSDSNAQMEVLGLLSKNISTMFGPLGNISLNTLFNVIPGIDLSKNSRILENINKIPGIELSGKAFRKFIAEINGNINSNDYVSSFKWIN